MTPLREIVVSLQREKAELESKLEAQQKVIDAFGSNVDGVHSLVTEIIEQRSLKLQVAELESKLCGMRDVLISIKEYWNGANNEKATSGALQHNIDIATQALSITPTCKHNEENGKQLASLQAELLEAKKWCFDDTTVKALREELKAVREENERLQAADKEAKK